MNASLRSVAFMFGITLIFTALVTGISRLSEDRIRVHQAVKRQRTILSVLGIDVPPDLPNRGLEAFFRSRIRSVTVKGRSFSIGYEADGTTIRGYAFAVGGPGFWGPIEGIAAVDPEGSRLLGIAFTRHSETPGLGGRIAEAWFTGQFRDLPLHPAADEDPIFRLAPADAPPGPGRLDAVTGASNTSEAVEEFLNRDLDEFLREFREELLRR